MAKAEKVQRPQYVLIIEDNVHHAELLTELLDRHFAPVIIHTVDSFADGLEFLSRSRYDLVFSTGFIGDESVKDVVGDMVSLADPTPVIVVTGRGDEALAAKLTRRGIAEYRVKSQETLEKLPHVIRKHLKRSAEARAEARTRPVSPVAGAMPGMNALVRELERFKEQAANLSSSFKSRRRSKQPLDLELLDDLESQIKRIRNALDITES